MVTQRIWMLKYVAGNPKMFSKVRAAAGGPFKRSEALQRANTIAANGWRVWVEHAVSGDRIFESEIEKQYAGASAA